MSKNLRKVSDKGTVGGSEYATPLSKVVGNVIYSKDGSVWVNYLLTGINVNPYNAAKLASAQAINDELFTSLSTINSSDFLLLGIKAQERPEDVIKRCVDGIPGLQNDMYPELVKQFNMLFRKMKSGELATFDRVYWLSVAMPVGRSITDKFMSRVVITDPHGDVTNKAVREFNDRVYSAIPDHFKPRPTTPEHVRWVFDRARLRGLEVPFEPKSDDAPIKFSMKSFPRIDIDIAADIVDQAAHTLGDVVGLQRIAEFQRCCGNIGLADALAHVVFGGEPADRLGVRGAAAGRVQPPRRRRDYETA